MPQGPEGWGGGERKAGRRAVNKVAFVIAERQFVTVPCKADKYNLSTELSISLSRTVWFCLKPTKNLEISIVKISTFTYLYSLTRSGMVTNLKDDSCDSLLLCNKKIQ